ncbi:hypothetical protein SGA01_26850 [Streptomyces gardneri]|uniref:Uncharacterized protein n=1 Tax=Streptomyces gardneri TaxID=66892 RepID=A0A4Y3RMN1_9ACTN|nr:hypothetical protein SGA01_26850 [Streptomyces gardneri]
MVGRKCRRADFSPQLRPDERPPLFLILVRHAGSMTTKGWGIAAVAWSVLAVLFLGIRCRPGLSGSCGWDWLGMRSGFAFRSAGSKAVEVEATLSARVGLWAT